MNRLAEKTATVNADLSGRHIWPICGLDFVADKSVSVNSALNVLMLRSDALASC